VYKTKLNLERIFFCISPGSPRGDEEFAQTNYTMKLLFLEKTFGQMTFRQNELSVKLPIFFRKKAFSSQSE
jgi:hypothetical protein